MEQLGLLSVSQQGVDAANDDHVQHDDGEQDAVVVKQIPADDNHQPEIGHEEERFHGVIETIQEPPEHCLPSDGVPLVKFWSPPLLLCFL